MAKLCSENASLYRCAAALELINTTKAIILICLKNKMCVELLLSRMGMKELYSARSKNSMFDVI